MADIIQLWTTKRDTPKDRWTVLHSYGTTGGVEVARCTREGYPGILYLIGMCSAASDTDALAEVPDTPEGVAILDFVASATLRAIDLAVMDAATTAGGAA